MIELITAIVGLLAAVVSLVTALRRR